MCIRDRVKPKPNPKSTEEMPIERSVFNKDMATISNPIPIMTKQMCIRDSP